MRKYFITGGTGFVGRALVLALLKRKDTGSILCLTRGTRSIEDMIQHQKLSYWKGNITDVELPDRDFTDVIHAAAEANDLLCPDKQRYYFDTVEGTRRILEWAQDRGVYRTLVVSSGAVHKGDSVYCRAKRMSEWLCERTTLQPKIARVYSLIGEEMPLDGQYALGRFIGSALKHGEVRYYQSASVRSYLNVDDCAQWLLKILDEGHPMRPYEVGASRPITVSDLAQLVAGHFRVKTKLIPAENHPTAEIYLPNVPLEFQTETITLEQSLRRIYAYLRDPDVEQEKPARAVH